MADIECTTEAQKGIRSRPQPSKAQLREGPTLIDKLKFAHLQKRNSIITGKEVRVDGQKRIPPWEGNLQVQINKDRDQGSQTGGTTLAQVLVHEVFFEMNLDDKAKRKLLEEVKDALKNSLKDGREYRVQLKP